MAQGKRHVWNETKATEVRAYATVGTPHHDIAILVDLSTKTLLKYYRKELDLGKARGNAEIGKTAFSQAKAGAPWAVCFWLKCQAGWRETSVVQNQQLDKHGNPINPPKRAALFEISFDDGGPGQGEGDSGVEVSPASAPEGGVEAS